MYQLPPVAAPPPACGSTSLYRAEKETRLNPTRREGIGASQIAKVGGGGACTNTPEGWLPLVFPQLLAWVDSSFGWGRERYLFPKAHLACSRARTLFDCPLEVQQTLVRGEHTHVHRNERHSMDTDRDKEISRPDGNDPNGAFGYIILLRALLGPRKTDPRARA